MLHEISYATKKYFPHQLIHALSAKFIGKADSITLYGPNDLSTAFHKANEALLKEQRGAGYWVWKPYCILKKMQEIADGDWIFYADAGSYCVNDLHHLINFAKTQQKEILLFSVFLPEGMYTKRDCFMHLGLDNEFVRTTPQAFATFILIKKNAKNYIFLKEYQQLVKEYSLVSDSQSKAENFPEFVAHRHDQSILSLLSKKYGIPLYRDPSEYGLNIQERVHKSHYPDSIKQPLLASTYPQIIECCRREIPFLYFIKLRLKRFLDM